MKKKFKIIITVWIALSFLAGCGAKAKVKQPTDSRIDRNYYTFTGEEFKNYFNEAIGSGSILKLSILKVKLMIWKNMHLQYLMYVNQMLKQNNLKNFLINALMVES